MNSEPSPPARLSAEELFRSHAKFVARFLVHLGVAAHDVDDVLQEVFLVVHARGGYVAGPAKPTSYLGSIAMRAAHTYRRRRNTQTARGAEDHPDELPSRQHDPVEVLEADERTRQIRAALMTLPEDLRSVLLLVELEGESCKSVAAGQNSPVGTVYWRLHQARKRFQKALEAQPELAQDVAPSLQKGWRW